MSQDKFTCQGCGTCCRWSGHVLLTAADITRLAEHLHLVENEFVQKHTTLAANRAQLTLVEQPGGACCFLGLDNACRVYPARPQQCREFPHTWRVSGCPAMPA